MRDEGTGIICQEESFTVNGFYTWEENTLTCDNGFVYNNTMVNGTDPEKWALSRWYKFIKIIDVS